MVEQVRERREEKKRRTQFKNINFYNARSYGT